LHELPAQERSRRTLGRGVLIFRWIWFGWMVFLAVTGEEFRRPELAWASLGLAGGWTIWLSAVRQPWDRRTLWGDLVVCGWLILASPLVVPEGDVVSGRAFFATGYPLSAPMLWGAARGPTGGVAAALVLGAAHVASRPLNGIALARLEPEQVQNLAGAVLNYIVAGVAVGLVSLVLVRSAKAVQEATERAARLAEREKFARQIHDSVLQALALVHKRGRELAQADQVPPEELTKLADIAADQEMELRTLILRDPEEAPSGRDSLRDSLERCARDFDGLNVNVSSVGPIWIERGPIEEITAAVKQALENVRRHAQASRVTVFAERIDGIVTVSVRDDGVGFEYDEQALRAGGKAGILKSMKGRVEELGGQMQITTSPGHGTEIEFKIPVETS